MRKKKKKRNKKGGGGGGGGGGVNIFGEPDDFKLTLCHRSLAGGRLPLSPHMLHT